MSRAKGMDRKTPAILMQYVVKWSGIQSFFPSVFLPNFVERESKKHGLKRYQV